MTSENLSVNLIPKEEVKKRTWGKFLNWTLTYGRYIIIGTEIILLLVLLLRFKLDRELKDLSDEVQKKQVQIKSYGDLEKQVRSLQSHLAVIKNLSVKGISSTQILASLSLVTPPEVIFDQLKVNPASIELSATAISLDGFASFIQALKRSKDFKNISLETLEETDMGIEFSLKFDYKKGS